MVSLPAVGKNTDWWGEISAGVLAVSWTDWNRRRHLMPVWRHFSAIWIAAPRQQQQQQPSTQLVACRRQQGKGRCISSVQARLLHRMTLLRRSLESKTDISSAETYDVCGGAPCWARTAAGRQNTIRNGLTDWVNTGTPLSQGVAERWCTSDRVICQTSRCKHD